MISISDISYGLLNLNCHHVFQTADLVITCNLRLTVFCIRCIHNYCYSRTKHCNALISSRLWQWKYYDLINLLIKTPQNLNKLEVNCRVSGTEPSSSAASETVRSHDIGCPVSKIQQHNFCIEMESYCLHLSVSEICLTTRLITCQNQFLIL